MAGTANIIAMHQTEGINEYVQRVQMGLVSGSTYADYLARKIREKRSLIAEHGDRYPSRVHDWQSYIDWALPHLERLLNPPALRTAAELELVGGAS